MMKTVGLSTAALIVDGQALYTSMSAATVTTVNNKLSYSAAHFDCFTPSLLLSIDSDSLNNLLSNSSYLDSHFRHERPRINEGDAQKCLLSWLDNHASLKDTVEYFVADPSAAYYLSVYRNIIPPHLITDTPSYVRGAIVLRPGISDKITTSTVSRASYCKIAGVEMALYCARLAYFIQTSDERVLSLTPPLTLTLNQQIEVLVKKESPGLH